MAQAMVDIKMLGDKALIRTLQQFGPKVQRTIVRAELKKSAKRIRIALIQAFSGHPVGVDTGKLLVGMAQSPIRPLAQYWGRGTNRIGFGIKMPERDQLGIDPKDPYYYPAVLEYGGTKKDGTHIPAKRPIRDTVNRMEPREKALIIMGMKKGMERTWKRLAKRSGVRVA